MMNILFVILLCLACPYNDNRDNSIAVLSTLQIIIVFIASMLMHASKLFLEGSYDAEVMGVLLIVSQAIIIVLFLAWAFYQKDNMSTSSNGMAITNLSGKKKKKKLFENDEEEGGGAPVEMTDVGVEIGLGSRKGSVFEVENPMKGKGGEQVEASFRQKKEGGEYRGAAEEDGNE
jgi:hypothetical protein